MQGTPDMMTLACQILFDHCLIMPIEYQRYLFVRLSCITKSLVAFWEHLRDSGRILEKLFTSTTTLYRFVTYIQKEGQKLDDFNICHPQLIAMQRFSNIVFVLCLRR